MITQTAINNLKLLQDKYSESLSLINDNNSLSFIEKDGFDPLCKALSLEYPVYFTYNHLLDVIAYDKSISYRSKKYLLELINKSFDNLVDYIDDYENAWENNELKQIIDDIYLKYDLIESKTIYNEKIENIIYLFDDLVDAFKTAKKYLYFSPCSYYPLINVEPGEFLDDDCCLGSEESGSDESGSDESGSDESGSDESEDKKLD